MGKAPRVYTGAYQDDSDGEGFNLAGAELKACYEVGAPPAPRPRSRAGGGGPPRSGWRSPSGMARTRSREEAGEEEATEERWCLDGNLLLVLLPPSVAGSGG